MGKTPSGGVVLNKVKPKTVNQNKFVQAIHENDVVICDGPAGSGKSLLSIALGCEWLLSGKIEQILIARTLIGCGDIGSLPGNEFEKAEPYFFAHLSYLEKILGKQYRNYIGQNKIILRPLEMLRGTTFDKTLMILDESQNADGKQIKMFLTRMGEYSKAVVIGDITQSDTSPEGFRFCINYLDGIENCSIIKLTYEDILRNSKIGHIIQTFNKNGY